MGEITTPPTDDDAILNIRFSPVEGNIPGKFMAHDNDIIEITWDEVPAEVAAGRYEIEGSTAVLRKLLANAQAAGVVAEFSWAASY